MPKPTRQDFAFLNDAQTEAVLLDLYTAAVRQIPGLIWHFLPQMPKLLGKGSGWTGENEAYFDDKYIPIVPQQGAFLYMQALAKGAKKHRRIRHVLRHFHALSGRSGQEKRRPRDHHRIPAA